MYTWMRFRQVRVHLMMFLGVTPISRVSISLFHMPAQFVQCGHEICSLASLHKGVACVRSTSGPMPCNQRWGAIIIINYLYLTVDITTTGSRSCGL